MRLSLSRMLCTIGILFAVLLMGCVLLLGILFGRTASINDAELRSTIVQNSAAQVSHELRRIIESMRTLALRDNVCNFAEGSPLQQYCHKEELRNTFDDLVQFIAPVVHIQLRINSGQSMGSSAYSAEFVTEYAAQKTLIEALDLDNFKTGSTRTAVLRTGNDALLAIAVPVENTMYRRTGAIIAICSLNNLAEHLMEDMPYLIQGEGEVLYASDFGLTSAWEKRTESGTMYFGGELCSIITQDIPEANWQLVSLYQSVPWHVFLRSSYNTLGICLLAIALVVFSLWVIYRRIVEPIENLAVQIDSVTASDGYVTNHYADRNELTRLAQGINTMNSRIRRLNEDILRKTQQLYQMKVMQMSERILLLQSQLNPHFLYNNLECIRGMTFMHNDEGIRDMTVHMAKIYRYCIRGGLSTVSAEIDSILSYLKIIELRYGPVYTIHCDIAEELGEIQCPRMILQPLVENSVLHGFVHEKRHAGSISVKVRSHEGVLWIEVEDDGFGMDAEKMRRMNDEFSQGITEDSDGWNDKVGLYNVNYRLKLIGDARSGLALKRSASGGLCVIVTLGRKI